MENIFLALGANLGNPEITFERAVGKAESRIGKVLKVSPCYRTAPLNPPELKETSQPDFYNCVIECDSDLAPQAIMQELLAIEKELGRDRSKEMRWGPRMIDFDFLAAGPAVISSPSLNLPHPQIQFRDFVLVPWSDIAGEFLHPVLNKTIIRLKDEFYASNPQGFILKKADN